MNTDSETAAVEPAERPVNPYRSARMPFDRADDAMRERQAGRDQVLARIAAEEAAHNSPQARKAREAAALKWEQDWAKRERTIFRTHVQGTEEYQMAKAHTLAVAEREKRYFNEDKEDKAKVAAFASELRAARVKARAKEKRL